MSTDIPESELVARLREIEARADSATPGPWQRITGVCAGIYGAPKTPPGPRVADKLGEIENRTDAVFVSHAREDIPFLLAELRLCRAALLAERMCADILEDGAEERPRSARGFQARVQPWMDACFGPEISADKTERNHRFLEEALELVQAIGCTRDEAHQLVDYTFDRPAGEASQEVGGVMVTLAALCLARGLDMHEAGETELARIWTKVDQIRAKQAAKPRGSALPIASPSIPAQYERAGEVDQFIPLADVQREAETCRIMLDKGEGDTDPLYAAYNALLMVLGYGTMPPSEMHAATPSPATGERDAVMEGSPCARGRVR